RALMDVRRAQGWVREVHGDLHLANLTIYNGKLLAFDRIEFDAALRWLDVVSDSAFLVMDLLHHGRRDLAFRFLNRYLEHTGDYRGLPLLRYHLVYRALVRAKVARLQAGQMQHAESRRVQARNADQYMKLADSLRIDVPPRLVLMHGLSGSGKTWASERLMTHLPALRLRSDVERKRLHGLAPGQRSGSEPGGQLYDEEANARTYTELATLAQIVLAAGYSVIVDAAFLRQWQRRLFAELAAQLMIPWSIVECRAPHAVLRRRLDGRARVRDEISEANAAVLDYQLPTAQPLDSDERRHALYVDSGTPFDAAAMSAAIRAAGGRR
ncbi:MAG: AAA family ATPase, partial [Gammaproteobacteria bacterium]